MVRNYRLFFEDSSILIVTFESDAVSQERKEVSHMATAQSQKFQKVECGPECGFMVKSSDEQELVRIVKEHAEKHHHMKVSDQEIKKMIKPA